MIEQLIAAAPTLKHWLILSAALFAIGLYGVLARKNAISVLMAIELMLNSANLAFVSFARAFMDVGGQVLVFFVMTVAAAEVAVGLALIVTIFRTKNTIDIDELHSMEG